MREIKFRAWDTESMYYEVYPHRSREVFDPNGGFWRKVEDIMQFSGLRDKNRKCIYEKDILEGLKFDGNKFKCIVSYIDKEARFIINVIGYMHIDGFSENWINEFNIKVIGNIYQNPELLNQ